MHSGRHYSLREVIAWTRRETAVFLLVAAVPTALYALADCRWLTLSWPPIAIVGGAVAFITGFKNNASYGRLWEARQVWGAIVNSSRTFAVLVHDFIPDNSARQRIYYRHLAWLTALRYQLRQPRSWENMRLAHNREYRRKYSVDEWDGSMEAELTPLLDAAEHSYVLARTNRAAHLIHLQSGDLRRNAEPGLQGEIRHVELERALASLLEAQGKCERIKNFPYPRQYATLNLFFIWLFIVLVPLGLLPEFQKAGDPFVWLTIPVSVMIAWVFHTMDKIGESSENPFEGGPNDVPITSMSRAIEIDLREMLGEKNIPPPIQPLNNILM
ncbi:MAG: bestrophin family ion channel [Bryobacteraceae bacterium]